MPRRLKPAIELLSDIGCKAYDLQHHSHADIGAAMKFMRQVNPEIFAWLGVVLMSATIVPAVGQAVEKGQG